MSRCLGFHRWVPMVWGLYGDLDARKCSRCGRLDIYAMGRWFPSRRPQDFADARPKRGARP